MCLLHQNKSKASRKRYFVLLGTINIIAANFITLIVQRYKIGLWKEDKRTDISKLETELEFEKLIIATRKKHTSKII